LERLASPRPRAAGLIQASETFLELRELFMIERGFASASDSIIGANAAKFNSPNRPLVTWLLELATQNLSRDVARPSSVCVADRARIDDADGINLEQKVPCPVTTTHLNLRPRPRPEGKRDRPVSEAGDGVFGEKHRSSVAS
jgi:hypothetical protein